MLRRSILVLLELLLVLAAMGLLGLAIGERTTAQGAPRPHAEQQGPGKEPPVQVAEGGVAQTTALNCRYGLSAWEPALSQVRPDQWGLGWYLTFEATGSPVGGMEYMRIVRTKQDKYWDGSTWIFSDTYYTVPPLTDGPGGLGPLVEANPGSWWAIGNEPDRGPDPCPWWWCTGQDAIFPDLYAQAYHEVYHFIRERDPSARIGPGGLVEVTPARLQYLDRFVEAYQQRYRASPPLDFWTFHLYILPETKPGGEGNSSAGIALGTDPALAFRESGGQASLCLDTTNNIYCWADHDHLPEFDLQVRRMRQWMKDRGWQEKPLWLSEFGILYYSDLYDEFGNCFTAPRVTSWLTRTFAYLESAADPEIGDPADGFRLVQRWAWFSLETYFTGDVSNIVTGTGPYTITQVGAAFLDELATYPVRTNLLAHRALPAAVRWNTAGVATATLYLEVVNDGETALTTPVTVTWYADAGLSVPIGSAVLADLPGCATRAVLTTTWMPGGEGLWPYWAKVDADDRLSESDEADNVTQGVVVVDLTPTYLPLVVRRMFP